MEAIESSSLVSVRLLHGFYRSLIPGFFRAARKRFRNLRQENLADCQLLKVHKHHKYN